MRQFQTGLDLGPYRPKCGKARIMLLPDSKQIENMLSRYRKKTHNVT